MRVSIDVPPPGKMRVGKEEYHVLEAGTELHRIHLGTYESAEFNGTSYGSARFSPIRDTSGQIIPTIYAGQTFECAVCEIILRCPDTPSLARTSLAPRDIVLPNDHRHRRHSQIRTTQDLRLVSITVSGQRKIGVNANGLLAGSKRTYPITQGWAARIHATCPSAQGLYYNSYQYGPDFAVVIFGDRVSADSLEPLSSRPVIDPACHDEIFKLADALSIDYADI